MNRPRVHRVAVVLAVSAAAAMAWSTPASAHGGPASIELVSDSATSEMARTYVVSISFDEDGHPVEDAQLTVVVEGAGGSVAPAAMTRTDTPGRFLADVRFPSTGTWTVRFTSVEPVATLEVEAILSVQATTSTAPTAPAVEAGASSSTTPVTTPPTTPARPGDPTAGVGSSPRPDDATKASNNTPLLVGLGVVAAVVIGGMVVLRRRSTPG